VPWLRAKPASAGIIAVLFYDHPGERSSVMGTNGLMPGASFAQQDSAKVLWILQHTPDPSPYHMTVAGTPLTGRGGFTQRLTHSAFGGHQFPSIVDVPNPGCWRLQVAAGTLHASVVIRVEPS
jgi:hypothetical protein